MNSCLYECRTVHARSSPKTYHFSHKIFFFYLDLAEVPELSQKFRRLGSGRKSLYEFRDEDHLPGRFSSCAENALSFARQEGYRGTPSKTMLLTHLRMFGYVFNPVSFYFFYGANGQAEATVAEVGNTFGEQKPYYLGPDSIRDGAFCGTQRKYYYISPFSDLDADLGFKVTPPDERLAIKIEETKNGKQFFFATVAGERRPLTDNALLMNTLRYPMMTFGVMAAIHWHAFRLWRLGVPHHRKESNPDLQRGAALVQKSR